MKKLLLLIGLIGALAFTPSVARALVAVPTNSYNLQDAADRGCNTKGQCSKGMVSWSVSQPYQNLWLADAPVSYTTSLGEEISFQVYFKQRDTLPPRTKLFRKWYWKASTLDGGGGGPPPDPPPPPPFVPPTGWNHNWFSYIRFSGRRYAAGEYSQDITNAMQDFSTWTATLHVPGGGEIDFRSSGSFEPADSPNNPHITQVSLLPMNGNPQHIYPAVTDNPPGPNVPFGGRNVYGQIGFRLVHADGSLDLYGRVTTLYGNAAIADALLTEHMDPSGNATKFYYTNFAKDSRTVYLLTHVVDYDGKTNTLTYTTNQLLARVDTPYGRYATFTYDHRGNLTNITDAVGLPSSMDYTYDGTNSQWVPFSLKTPYGTMQLTFHDDGLGSAGNAGGTNRIDRFLGVTHDDGSKELFLYRFDSSQQGIPANIPEGQLPNAPLSSLDAGNSGTSTNLTPFYTRNSFHWNRQQTAARSITNLTLANLATLTSNDYKLAVMTHWLVRSVGANTFLSEVPSMRQEASSDGIATGAGAGPKQRPRQQRALDAPSPAQEPGQTAQGSQADGTRAR
jgi:hypothetical protein